MADKKMTSKISSECKCENVIHFGYIWWNNTKTVQKSRQGKFSRTFTDCTSFVCFTILACEIALSTNQILDITKIGKLNNVRLNTCLIIFIANDITILYLLFRPFLRYQLYKIFIIIYYFVGRHFNFIVHTMYSRYSTD